MCRLDLRGDRNAALRPVGKIVGARLGPVEHIERVKDPSERSCPGACRGRAMTCASPSASLTPPVGDPPAAVSATAAGVRPGGAARRAQHRNGDRSGDNCEYRSPPHPSAPNRSPNHHRRSDRAVTRRGSRLQHLVEERRSRGCSAPRRARGGPASTTTPRSMKATVSATCRAKPISWVTTTMVIPAAARSAISARTPLTSSGSSAEVASSKSITSGCSASARAIATRCC